MNYKKFLASILAGLSTPEAVKIEKSIAVVALTRLLILGPSAAFIIDKVVSWLQ